MHDTVPRVNNLYCFFYVKNSQKVLHYGLGEIVSANRELNLDALTATGSDLLPSQSQIYISKYLFSIRDDD